MPIITLPDGSTKNFASNISVFDIASDISLNLAKLAIAGKVNSKLVDTSYIIDKDSKVKILTANDDEGLEVIRHSAAHVLAQAVKSLYPDVQVAIGPVINDGFYYDFSYKAGFSTIDLEKIENKIKEIIAKDLKIERVTMSRGEAIKLFTKMGEHYKVEIIKAIPKDEFLSLYKQGDFIDLCRGPHVPNTAKLKAIKLMKVAGAYWRGDSNNEMLQRIYGTAFKDNKDLKKYLFYLEEAKKRDHRLIGKTQNLFHTQEEAPGMVFWHPMGWRLYKLIEQFMRGVFNDNGYQEIHTPQILDRSLWEKSGHWDKFSDDMFITKSENRDYAIKPMNCPAHVQVYNKGLKSYRDLPLRLAEFGSCHRNEASGTLHGLMRVRNFVQDDAHIFCTQDQIQKEVSDFIDLTFKVYKHFGFENVSIKLSTRPENRVGSDLIWDKAEQALESALNNKNLKWELQAGEGAFYGPKIDFVLKDTLNRDWQCGTLQIDFSMPERLAATYIDENNTKKTPVMIHRAILGSLERFVGILIEHYGGAYPIWLAPVQVMILNISKNQEDYVKKIAKKLQENNIRVEIDLRNEKVGFKIREHLPKRYPFILVVGDKEVADNKVAVRKRDSKESKVITLDKFIKLFIKE